MNYGSPPIDRLQAYFAYLEASDTRAEYERGTIVDMAGGHPEHSRIAMNLGGAIGAQLWDGPCSVFGCDLLVELDLAEAYYFPDLTVICGPLERSMTHSNAVRNPQVVVEVMSPSSVERDRTSKLIRYMQIPSLREYILVDMHKPAVEVVFINSQGHWISETIVGIGSSFQLRSLDITIPLEKVYRAVDFTQA